MSSDQEIIRSVLSGDIEAFAGILHKYQDKVLRLCFAIVGPQDAEDAAQETFLKVYDSLSKFREESAFSTWLYRITSNHCLDILSKRKRRKEESLESLVERAGENVLAGSSARHLSSSGNLAQSVMDRETVRGVLERMPPEERAILVLREMEGLSYLEISQTMEISMDLVKVRLFRARKLFQKIAQNLS